VPGLTDRKEGIGRWTEGSKPGTGYLGLPPIKGDKSGLMRRGLDGCLWATLNGHEAGNGGYSHLSAVPGTGRRVGLWIFEPILYSTVS
jgi:hypothetical protein